MTIRATAPDASGDGSRRATRRMTLAVPNKGRLVEPVLAHRLLLTRDAVIDGREAAAVLREVAAAVPVPAEGAAAADAPAAV